MKKYIPKGIYCYDDMTCPFWFSRRHATKHDAEAVFNDENKIWNIETLADIYECEPTEESVKDALLKIMNESGVYGCKYIGLTDMYQGGSLIWDMCKACDRCTYEGYEIPKGKRKLPNKYRVRGKKGLQEWLALDYFDKIEEINKK